MTNVVRMFWAERVFVCSLLFLWSGLIFWSSAPAVAMFPHSFEKLFLRNATTSERFLENKSLGKSMFTTPSLTARLLLVRHTHPAVLLRHTFYIHNCISCSLYMCIWVNLWLSSQLRQVVTQPLCFCVCALKRDFVYNVIQLRCDRNWSESPQDLKSQKHTE